MYVSDFPGQGFIVLKLVSWLSKVLIPYCMTVKFHPS